MHPPVFIDTIKLIKANSDNIVKEVKFLLRALIQNRCSRHNFKFLVTDGATYCLKVGRLLKDEYVEMKHIVCVCYNIHLLAEELKKKYNNTNEFVSLLKKSLIKKK